MRVIRPVSITESTLLSSNVPEDDAPAWASGSYALGDSIISNHHVYESLADGNTAVPGQDSTKWLDKGATNRWRMFDKRAGNTWLIGRYTDKPDTVDVTIRPGRVVNAVGLVGVRATSVRVVLTDPVEGVVFDRTASMVDTGAINWYDYWFSPFGRRLNLAILDIPAYGSADVRVIVSYPGGTAEVGMLVLGSQITLGIVEWGVDVSSQSYSVATEDDWGNLTLVPRGRKRIVSYPLRIETPRISNVLRALDDLQDTPSLYVGHPDIDATIVCGRFDRLASVISNPALCDMSLEVRSLQ